MIRNSLIVAIAVMMLTGCMQNDHQFRGSYVCTEDETVILHFLRNDRAITNLNSGRKFELYRISRTDADIALVLEDRDESTTDITDFEIDVSANGYILKSTGRWTFTPMKQKIKSGPRDRPI